MATQLSNLTKSQQRKFFADLNYLNTIEIQNFCKKHRIPYAIVLETSHGIRRKTGEHDRKGVMLKRVRHFLKYGAILRETCIPARVVRFETPKRFSAGENLFYGQYDKANHQLVALLKKLTDGAFQDGAIARILCRQFWTAGTAPTFKQYAAAWLKAREAHRRPNPEWAFLSDLADKTAGKNWKKLRAQKAKNVVATLNKIPRKNYIEENI